MRKSTITKKPSKKPATRKVSVEDRLSSLERFAALFDRRVSDNEDHMAKHLRSFQAQLEDCKKRLFQLESQALSPEIPEAPDADPIDSPSDRFPVGSIVEYGMRSQCLLTPTGNIILNHESDLPAAGTMSREEMIAIQAPEALPTHDNLDEWLTENGPKSAEWLRELFRLEAEQQLEEEPAPTEEVKEEIKEEDGQYPLVGTVVEIGHDPCLITPVGNIVLNGCSPHSGSYSRNVLVEMAKESGPQRFILTHNSLDEYLEEFPKSNEYLKKLSDLLFRHDMAPVVSWPPSYELR